MEKIRILSAFPRLKGRSFLVGFNQSMGSGHAVVISPPSQTTPYWFFRDNKIASFYVADIDHFTFAIATHLCRNYDFQFNRFHVACLPTGPELDFMRKSKMGSFIFDAANYMLENLPISEWKKSATVLDGETISESEKALLFYYKSNASVLFNEQTEDWRAILQENTILSTYIPYLADVLRVIKMYKDDEVPLKLSETQKQTLRHSLQRLMARHTYFSFNEIGMLKCLFENIGTPQFTNIFSVVNALLESKIQLEIKRVMPFLSNRLQVKYLQDLWGAPLTCSGEFVAIQGSREPVSIEAFGRVDKPFSKGKYELSIVAATYKKSISDFFEFCKNILKTQESTAKDRVLEFLGTQWSPYFEVLQSSDSLYEDLSETGTALYHFLDFFDSKFWLLSYRAEHEEAPKTVGLFRLQSDSTSHLTGHFKQGLYILPEFSTLALKKDLLEAIEKHVLTLLRGQIIYVGDDAIIFQGVYPSLGPRPEPASQAMLVSGDSSTPPTETLKTQTGTSRKKKLVPK